MFIWIGQQFDTTLFAYVGTVVARLFSYLVPVALAWLTIRVALYGYKVLTGKVCEPVMEFAENIIVASVIVAFATVGGVYHGYVIDVYNAMVLDVVKIFVPAGSELQDAHNVWATIERFNERSGALTAAIVTDGIFSLQVVVAAIALVIFSFGTVFFLLACMLVTVMTKGFGTFILAIGPIFMLFLMFETTRQWFVNWLGTLFGLAVLSWLVFFLMGFSLALQLKLVEAISANIGQFNVLTQAMTYLVLCLVFAVMLWSAPSFVHGLTGGGAAQMGVQMASQIYYWLRKGKASSPSSNPSAGGNSMNRSHGWAYRAGAAVGNVTGVAHAFQRLAARGRP
ncbi:type IV secretion system protein [Azohydromonas australica]|uniref:type IV secretion system protein n=1 Tax=Azohydromonas australica TaxID=364039 RepID=UPI0003F98C3A|nr:type IV secretion system protein [Azohydromonas australica]